MKTIYKYLVEATMYLPVDSVIIDFAEQEGSLCLWAIVDTDNELVDRYFNIVGTGWEISSSYESKYIKTAHCSNGLVWHLFEVFNMKENE